MERQCQGTGIERGMNNNDMGSDMEERPPPPRLAHSEMFFFHFLVLYRILK